MIELRLTDTEPHAYYVAWTRYCPRDQGFGQAVTMDPLRWPSVTRSRLFRTYEEAHLHREEQLARVRDEYGTPINGGVTEVCTQLIEDEDGNRLY